LTSIPEDVGITAYLALTFFTIGEDIE
jgi:hypothetical protein